FCRVDTAVGRRTLDPKWPRCRHAGGACLPRHPPVMKSSPPLMALVFSSILMDARKAPPHHEGRRELAMTDKSRERRAIVIGGSIAGLFVGAFLRRLGWQSTFMSAHQSSSLAVASGFSRRI